jgi:hypothetical protein
VKNVPVLSDGYALIGFSSEEAEWNASITYQEGREKVREFTDLGFLDFLE